MSKITYYTSPHVGTRGSLSSIKATGYGELDNITEEDQEWEQQVKLAFMTHQDSFHTFYNNYNFLLDEMEDNAIIILWEPYKRQEAKFDEKFFIPFDH